MNWWLSFLAAGYAALLGAAPAHADDLFGGVYVHDVNILTESGIERGVDFQLGWRGPGILGSRRGPQPYVLGSANSAGGADFAAAGIAWRIGGRLYVRPGVGIAVHDGPKHWSTRRIWFGSRILFEPELGIGVQLTRRASAEASWVHLSHGQLFNRQNPGLDIIGLRLNYRFR